MIAYEGRIQIKEKSLIDLELFVPNTSVFYGAMFPIYSRFPIIKNRVFFDYGSSSVEILHNKVKNAPNPISMKRPRFKGVTDLRKQLSEIDIKDFSEGQNEFSAIPCTLAINTNYNLLKSDFGVAKIHLSILIDITDTKIVFHWRKTDGSGVSFGSTPDSTAGLSYNNDNIIQFIVTDRSTAEDVNGVRIAARDVEKCVLTKGESLITPDIFKGELSDVLNRSNPDWVYNTGKYVKAITKTIFETEVLDDTHTQKEDNDEQSGDNV